METPFQPEDSYVEKLWNDLSDLEQCGPQLGATLLVNIRSAFAKAMILAAGNWLERRTQQALLFFARSASSNDALVYFVKNRVLYRQFHTLFDWDTGKVNSFLGKFGPDFKKKVKAANGNGDIHRASHNFMELVAERNSLAHDSRINDEAQFTPSEVRTKFYNAAGWISWISQVLADGNLPAWNPPSPPTPQDEERTDGGSPSLPGVRP